MNQEIKVCQNCKQNFTVESESFDKLRISLNLAKING